MSISTFLDSVDLEGLETYATDNFTATSGFLPSPGVEQAAVVGNELQSFAPGVPSVARLALQNAMLLAQLHAKKVAPNNTVAWYESYFETLVALGLISDEQAHVFQRSTAIEGDVEKALLELIAAIVGGAATTTVAIVAAAVGALKRLGDGSPAITIFKRESKSVTGRFQVSHAYPVDDSVGVLLVAMTVDASAVFTEVLFFKVHVQQATLKQTTARFLTTVESLSLEADHIAKKVADFREGYISQLEI